MELGLGIHGEPGLIRTHVQHADEVSEMLLKEILRQHKFGEDKRAVLMVNNLGATTEMELAIVARHVMLFLEKCGFTVERNHAGTFLSSLDMAGISIVGVNDGRLLDAPTAAPAWPNVPKQRSSTFEVKTAAKSAGSQGSTAHHNVTTDAGRRAKQAIDAACEALIRAEPKLTELDRLTR